MYSKVSPPVRFAKVGEKVKIKKGLALTPSQMDEYRRKGKPINTVIDESNYYDGDERIGFEIPITSQRGVDIADIWNAQMDARKSMTKLQTLVEQQNVQTFEKN